MRLNELSDTLRDFGWSYLMTVGPDSRTHVVAASPHVDGEELHVPTAGRRTRANAAERPAVVLAFPPSDAGGYTLIVDGDAEVDGETLRVRPTSAVLHRPAAPGAEPSASGCSADCHHVDVEPAG